MSATAIWLGIALGSIVVTAHEYRAARRNHARRGAYPGLYLSAWCWAGLSVFAAFVVVASWSAP